MKIQSIGSSSLDLMAERQAKAFAEGAGADTLPLPGDTGDGAKQDPEPQALLDAVSKANLTLEIYNTELRFSIHQASGEVQVKVINTKDNSVIREIPPESVLNFVAHVKETLGVIIDRFI